MFLLFSQYTEVLVCGKVTYATDVVDRVKNTFSLFYRGSNVSASV